jgi:MFS family permease
MTSLCKEYWQFMLAQGVLSGVSCGLLMIPAMSAVPQYFSKKRGAAMGIAIAGSSFGAVVFPIILSKLLNDTDIGFGWTVRITAFIMVPILVLSALAIKARLPPRESNFFLFSAFRDPGYDIVVAGAFFLFLGMFTPLLFLPTYAVLHGMDETTASYLVAMVNGASIPGRIIPGVLGDKVGRLNALSASGVSTAVIIFCWPRVLSNAGVIVYAVILGFFSGTIISGGSVAFTLFPKDAKDIGTFMGMGMALTSLAVLVGPPASGAMLRTYGGFEQISIMSGVCCMFGAVLVLLAKATTSHGIRSKY